MKIVDLYKILDLTSAATSTDIKAAYKKLALIYHPDKNDSGGAEEKFKSIKNAYEILIDESKRKFYDAARLNPNYGTPSPQSKQGQPGHHHHPSNNFPPQTPQQMQYSLQLSQLTMDYNRRMMEHNVKKTKYNAQRTKEPTVSNLYDKYTRESEYYQLKVEALENETLYYEMEKIYNQLQKENGVQVGYFEKQIEDCLRKIETTQSRIDYFRQQAEMFNEKAKCHKMDKRPTNNNPGGGGINPEQNFEEKIQSLNTKFKKESEKLESKFVAQNEILMKTFIDQTQLLMKEFNRQQREAVESLKKQSEVWVRQVVKTEEEEDEDLKMMEEMRERLDSRVGNVHRDNLNGVRNLGEQHRKWMEGFKRRNHGLIVGIGEHFEGIRRKFGDDRESGPEMKRRKSEDEGV